MTAVKGQDQLTQFEILLEVKRVRRTRLGMRTRRCCKGKPTFLSDTVPKQEKALGAGKAFSLLVCRNNKRVRSNECHSEVAETSYEEAIKWMKLLKPVA